MSLLQNSYNRCDRNIGGGDFLATPLFVDTNFARITKEFIEIIMLMFNWFIFACIKYSILFLSKLCRKIELRQKYSRYLRI